MFLDSTQVSFRQFDTPADAQGGFGLVYAIQLKAEAQTGGTDQHVAAKRLLVEREDSKKVVSTNCEQNWTMIEGTWTYSTFIARSLRGGC
jgi:hypothetical protein